VKKGFMPQKPLDDDRHVQQDDGNRRQNQELNYPEQPLLSHAMLNVSRPGLFLAVSGIIRQLTHCPQADEKMGAKALAPVLFLWHYMTPPGCAPP
jgi:hypothetical protein